MGNAQITSKWARNKRLTILVVQGMTLAEASRREGISATRARQIVAQTLNITKARVQREHRVDITHMYKSEKMGTYRTYQSFSLTKARKFRENLVPAIWNTRKPRFNK